MMPRMPSRPPRSGGRWAWSDLLFDLLMLEDLYLRSRANQKWYSGGIDDITRCLDRQHWQTYAYPVQYQYNSRGFRDEEWPTDPVQLRDAVWCVGDSFTVGVGQPYDHIWPQVLSRATGRRTINVSMDGASNDWIARRARQILDQLAPRNMVVMWSYVHRRENPDCNLADEDRLMFCDARRDSDSADDHANLVACRGQLLGIGTQVIEAAIPNFCVFGPHETAKDRDSICGGILTIHQLDRARDGHHFDILTAEHFVQDLLPLLD